MSEEPTPIERTAMDIAFALYGGPFVDDEPFGGIPERSMAEGVALLNKFVAEKDAQISALRDALAKLVATQDSCAMEYTEADWIAARKALGAAPAADSASLAGLRKAE